MQTLQAITLIFNDLKSLFEALFYLTSPIGMGLAFLAAKRSGKNGIKGETIRNDVQELKLSVNGRLEQLMQAKIEAAFAAGIEHSRKIDLATTTENAVKVLHVAATEAATVLSTAVETAKIKLDTKEN